MTPRLRVRLAAWLSGTRVTLPADATRHVRALRLGDGDGVVLFDGASDVEWPATIVAIDRVRVEVLLGGPVAVDRELGVRVTLAVAMPANDRMDALVEKATELGACALQPLTASRSVLRLSGSRAEARRAHWQAVASSASEQCGRVRVPEIAMPTPLDAWLAGLSARDPAMRVVLSLDDSARPLAAVADENGVAERGVIVLSGPEGGFDDDEEGAARACGFVPASLGPRVLRADTAPLAALVTIAAAVT